MEFVVYFNVLISTLFTLCYFYQFVYVVVELFKKSNTYKANKLHKYAVIVAARNEDKVIGELLNSIQAQTYPKELLDVYVVADNSTDKTAEIAKNHGAYVYERNDNVYVGKGYALDWLFHKIKREHADQNYEAFIVFDADNVISETFVEEMNKMFDNGYRIITSYRNSKNYADNWITAGYSLWFLREAKFLNDPRMQIGTSCAISGTGFLVSSEIINNNGGWIHHLLTEDIEFTVSSILDGEQIGYCRNAVLFDEQPTTLHQSYLQRLRWAKGFYQVVANYGSRLFRGIFKKSFSCYDLLMTVMPAMLFTLLSTLMNIVAIPVAVAGDSPYLPILLRTLGQTFFSFYMVFFLLGAITTITEWKQIHCSSFKKILYTFTFPIFMATYVPISIIALFKKVKWEPILHKVSKTASEI